jgi:nucleotide-binding universal stress UspA family protein
VQLTIAMRIGQAGQKILEYAAEQDIDLIIIGRQGTGTVGKIFFGNVSELVVRKAQCPVMVIPPPTK